MHKNDLIFLNMAIEGIDKLEHNENNNVKYNFYIQRIITFKKRIEKQGENSEQNIIANKLLKKLGYNHPEMRSWLSSLIFKSGTKEIEKHNIQDRIRFTMANFENAVNTPAINITTVNHYKVELDHLQVELIQNKDNMSKEEYIKCYELLNDAIAYGNIISSSFEEEMMIWGK